MSVHSIIVVQKYKTYVLTIKENQESKLQVNEYCSEVISFLPPGIIIKSHTGIGATHF